MVGYRFVWFAIKLALFSNIFLTAVESFAAVVCDPVAKIVSVQGVVEVRRASQTAAQPARLNDVYCAGDQISVGERSRADVALTNEPLVRLDQNTTLTLSGPKPQGGAVIQLLRGVIYFFSRLPRNLDINTTYVNAGVEGTEGLVAVEANRTLISIFEGGVLAANAAGNLAVVSGQSAVAEAGRAPVLTVIARPRDAVRWALFYVPTLYFRAADFPAGADWQGMVRNSIEAVNRRDYAAAFEAIRTVPANLTAPRFFAYRASLLLAVGRYDEASGDLARALSLSANYSDGLALQAIISVVQNDKDRALELAKRAVSADTKSAAAFIALSYAQQANFDLDGALASLQQAVQVNPDNALAWARLAEVWLMFGQLNEALTAAQKAASLDANLARTQTVLGFAYLTLVNTADARRAFERAIELDNADPLPRLGLGLAKIRDGELIEGRKELDIAVSLDPDNALIRSYLGKAYFEQKLDKQAADQYEMSKQLDPKDPTPFFYDAIRKQTTNRPVEALQDLQKAIELNDNRAVYRSRQLLDSDAAARSAAMGRIYSDLGFQQRALVEGWRSVNSDPANFSAHRLLADSYAILPRHEIARVSELLQSQLLQPLNMTPIQPRLAESNLFLIAAGGPAALSFNEFNPLFNRNGVNFQTTGLVGANHTYSGEGVLSGIYQQFAFSAGGSHFQTDGYRANTLQRDNIGNVFAQFEASSDTSFLAEVRRRENRRGDIQQRFFPEELDRTLSDNFQTFTARFGGRYGFSPDSTLLGAFTYQDRDNVQTSSPIFLSRRAVLPQRAVGGELQHLWRFALGRLVSGMGYFDFDQRTSVSVVSPFFSFNSQTAQSARHFNVYSYANIDFARWLTLTVGGSFDDARGDRAAVKNRHQSAFNTKFGLSLNLTPDTTIRGSVSRMVKRNLVADQTLEPTQVAGFNQFFDDLNLTRAWRYGVALDQRIGKELFGGLEASRRDLKIPTTSGSTIVAYGAKEYVGRAYLLWTPHPWWAIRTEFSYEGLRNQFDTGEPTTVNTYRLPIGVNFFHPTGVGASLLGTYYNQSGDFILAQQCCKRGQDQFWTLDGALSYRLPQRYGLVTFGALNLLDKKFKYFEVDRDNPRVQPNRSLFLKLTLALP